MRSSSRSIARAPRYLAWLEYDGAALHGFQRQADGASPTAQGAFDSALRAFAGDRADVRSVGSSRTDVGVHALRNAVHFDLLRFASLRERSDAADARRVRLGLNSHLSRINNAVNVVECVRVDDMNPEFHARHDAIERKYAYDIVVGDARRASVFDRGRAWYVTRDRRPRFGFVDTVDGRWRMRSSRPGFWTCGDALDVGAMRDAAREFVGALDFSSFRAKGCQSTSALRSVTSVEVYETHAMYPSSVSLEVEQRIRVAVAAPSFLYHQVRLIVGALKAVGAGDIAPRDVREILNARDPSLAPQLAPACGLYLTDVSYLPGYASRPPFASVDAADAVA